jgi:hypothetical protein
MLALSVYRNGWRSLDPPVSNAAEGRAMTWPAFRFQAVSAVAAPSITGLPRSR